MSCKYSSNILLCSSRGQPEAEFVIRVILWCNIACQLCNCGYCMGVRGGRGAGGPSYNNSNNIHNWICLPKHLIFPATAVVCGSHYSAIIMLNSFGPGSKL